MPIKVLAIAVGLAVAAGPVHARSVSTDAHASVATVVFADQAPVPSGYYDLCYGGNAVCLPSRGRDDTRADGSVAATDALLAQLDKVNGQVNRAIRPMTDMQHYGVADRWVVSPHAGDCEDFALTKKARLLKLGWPSSALLLATALTRSGEEHVVLVARTDQGDFVLDNLRAGVVPWTAHLYRWRSIQSPFSEWRWSTFAQPRVEFAAADLNVRTPGSPEQAASVGQLSTLGDASQPRSKPQTASPVERGAEWLTSLAGAANWDVARLLPVTVSAEEACTVTEEAQEVAAMTPPALTILSRTYWD